MEQQIEQLWLSFQKPLYAFVRKSVQNVADADDIVQDVFIKLMKHPEKLSSPNIKAYLYTTAKNTVIDHYRSQKRQYLADIPEPSIVNDTVDVTSELIELATCCLHLLINELPDIYRDALTEVDIKGMSQKKYAEELGISYTGAKSRVQRGRELLHDQIMGCCKYLFDENGSIVGIQKKSLDACVIKNKDASFWDMPRFINDNSLV